MSRMVVDFEFEIGQIVFFKSANHANGFRPATFAIYERVAQQCHGGIQCLYRLSGIEGLTPEPMLTRKEPEYRPMSEAELSDRVRVIQAQIKARRAEFLSQSEGE